mmetsp:Transcript_4593/g.8286  ORF Transcript_4593/g.8286 Transcript_4593/m.8286 type:complete len:107 (+) Transcript_4593:7-327(+)
MGGWCKALGYMFWCCGAELSGHEGIDVTCSKVVHSCTNGDCSSPWRSWKRNCINLNMCPGSNKSSWKATLVLRCSDRQQIDTACSSTVAHGYRHVSIKVEFLLVSH